MNWISVRAELEASPDDYSPLHGVFASHGLEATVQHDDPPGMSAYFCEEEDCNERIAALGEALIAFGATRIHVEAVPEEDWSESWKQFFKPREIGTRFVIKPTWEEIEPTERMVIELDPGQAFGTGEHATTQLCLCMLEEAVESGDVVIDVGCGSGILSIAAVKLGAKVHATEIDAPAAAVAAENAKRNAAHMEIAVADQIPESFPQADIVVSNIVSATIIRLCENIGSHVKAGGTWIASGIIPANLTDVIAAAETQGFKEAARREDGGWVSIVFRR
ncbi:MAG: 50S ribosomal protein L11 methyltransferase [Armatimonadota bacterium]|nr:50S ribosomal protein L11 methyltransferase [Armatimonadota bacterium]